MTITIPTNPLEPFFQKRLTDEQKQYLNNIFKNDGEFGKRERKAFKEFADSNHDGKLSMLEKFIAFSVLESGGSQGEYGPVDRDLFKKELKKIYDTLA